MRLKIGILFAFTVFICATLFFQNCSRVDLARDEASLSPDIAKGSGSFCFSGDYSDLTVDSFYILNSSTVPKSGRLLPDTDGDGMSDEDEIRYGFSPVKRRTNSLLLDSVCFYLAGNKNCDSFIAQDCDAREGKDGLSDCDRKVLSLAGFSADFDYSIDSDGDGIADYIEVIRGGDPRIKDANADSDNDGVLNFNEIHRQSDLQFYQADIDSRYELIYSLSKQKKSANCNGELWTLTVDQIPLLPLHEYKDVTLKSWLQGGLDFSHLTDENSISLWLLLGPKAGVGSKSFFVKQLRLSKFNSSFVVDLKDFVRVGGAE